MIPPKATYATALFLLIAGCDAAAFDTDSAEMVDARRYETTFGDLPATGCLPDGSVFEEWTVQFAGYGCVRPETEGEASWLALAPAPVDDPALTRAALVVGPRNGPRFRLKTRVISDAQLRTGSDPNPWEAAWVVWDYTDDAHFYYLILKPNGWEIGKRDPAYPGGQRFLATGTSPTYPIGRWNNVTVQRGRTDTRIAVDGVELTRFVDTERPYRDGRIGLYTEDAAVRVRSVSLSPR